MAHDQLVVFLSSLIGQTLTIKDVLLYYRQHENNAVGFVAPADYGGFASTFLRIVNHIRDPNDGANKRKYVLGNLRARFLAATARQTMTERVMSRLPEIRAQRLRPQLRYYQTYARSLSARLLAYDRPSRAQRAAAILSALGKGRYNEAGGAGAREVGIDLLYGVMGTRSFTAPDL